jgi:hypothetical protein
MTSPLLVPPTKLGLSQRRRKKSASDSRVGRTLGSRLVPRRLDCSRLDRIDGSRYRYSSHDCIRLCKYTIMRVLRRRRPPWCFRSRYRRPLREPAWEARMESVVASAFHLSCIRAVSPSPYKIVRRPHCGVRDACSSGCGCEHPVVRLSGMGRRVRRPPRALRTYLFEWGAAPAHTPPGRRLVLVLRAVYALASY